MANLLTQVKSALPRALLLLAYVRIAVEAGTRRDELLFAARLMLVRAFKALLILVLLD